MPLRPLAGHLANRLDLMLMQIMLSNWTATQIKPSNSWDPTSIALRTWLANYLGAFQDWNHLVSQPPCRSTR